VIGPARWRFNQRERMPQDVDTSAGERFRVVPPLSSTFSRGSSLFSNSGKESGHSRSEHPAWRELFVHGQPAVDHHFDFHAGKNAVSAQGFDLVQMFGEALVAEGRGVRRTGADSAMNAPLQASCSGK